MNIHAITKNCLSFCSGKTVLFTDFDGTFLPQPLHDLYHSSEDAKKTTIENFNKFFSQIQSFSERNKEKFDIFITTGRRFGDKTQKEGFNAFYDFVKSSGIKFPEIKGLITSEGGDLHSILPNGKINPVPDASKAQQIETLTGWSTSKITAALDYAAQKTNTSYNFVNYKGSYKLSVKISDQSKLAEFYDLLKNALEGKVKFRSSLTKIKDYISGDLYREIDGIKLEPTINGHRLHKDFDIKIAIKNAITNNDFVIAAGDAMNDKEMLNIFRYINMDGKIPKTASEITPELVKITGDKINALPLKILFIRPSGQNTDKNILLEFMQKLEQLFPQKVQIVEQTFPGKNNNYLDAIEQSINNFFKKSNTESKKPLGKIYFGAAACILALIGIAKFFDKNNNCISSHNNIPDVYKNFK